MKSTSIVCLVLLWMLAAVAKGQSVPTETNEPVCPVQDSLRMSVASFFQTTFQRSEGTIIGRTGSDTSSAKFLRSKKRLLQKTRFTVRFL